MEWILYATVSAILFTAVAVISKELMDHIDAVRFTAIYSALAAFFYTPVLLYYLSTSDTGLTALLAVLTLLSGLGNVAGMLAYNYSLSKTQISVAMPLNRVQPVFVGLLGVLLLGETMSTEKVLGIGLVTFASYIILLEGGHEILDPVKNLLDDRGAQLALASAVFFSATSIIDRFVTEQFSPQIYTFLILASMATALNAYMIKKDSNHVNKSLKEILNYRKMYAYAGLMTAIAYLVLYIAFSQAEASKVVPVLQLQVPLTVLLGQELFKEGHIIQKIIASILLIAGVILVV